LTGIVADVSLRSTAPETDADSPRLRRRERNAYHRCPEDSTPT